MAKTQADYEVEGQQLYASNKALPFTGPAVSWQQKALARGYEAARQMSSAVDSAIGKPSQRGKTVAQVSDYQQAIGRNMRVHVEPPLTFGAPVNTDNSDSRKMRRQAVIVSNDAPPLDKNFFETAVLSAPGKSLIAAADFARREYMPHATAAHIADLERQCFGVALDEHGPGVKRYRRLSAKIVALETKYANRYARQGG
jgi:hypothetical protein